MHVQKTCQVNHQDCLLQLLVNNDFEFWFFVGYLLAINLFLLLLPLFFYLFVFSTPSILKFKHRIANRGTEYIFNWFIRNFLFIITADFNNVLKVIYGIFCGLDKYVRMFHYFRCRNGHNFPNQLPMFLTGPLLRNNAI